ncbi:hypothetical protein KCH_35130 [Kitasatospora cheerisanensis KCTC 2395]|uniref:Uncharacterized protein n=1 Tax=Kitasatospora cheerisanensis KCTC 2395 TaxID=1348663 RepID=A0A066Z3L9_9ACTN|nr:hypothetical protein KCH_35130 [Kitasatospora cheerisanensis KCTC 2395]
MLTVGQVTRQSLVRVIQVCELNSATSAPGRSSFDPQEPSDRLPHAPADASRTPRPTPVRGVRAVHRPVVRITPEQR